MFRTFLAPILSFLAGLGVLKAAIPLESLTLMGLGLALSGFGLLRLLLRDDGNGVPLRAARAEQAAPAPDNEA
jgi:hypothetical protein